MRLEYFQMIDTVEQFDDAQGTLTASSTVPNQSTIFHGHFQGYPIMPGVLLIETMAQCSGFMILGRNKFAQMPFLVGVKQGKLRTFVEPNTKLDVFAQLDHDGSGFAVTKARIKTAGKALCDAHLTFKLMDFPAPELEAQLREQAEIIGLPF